MTHIVSLNASGSTQNLQPSQVAQGARIRFENTLAAVRSDAAFGDKSDMVVLKSHVQPSAEMPVSRDSVRRSVPAQKVIASLTHLVAQNKTGATLDVVQ